jgi:hypothetical protein
VLTRYKYPSFAPYLLLSAACATHVQGHSAPQVTPAELEPSSNDRTVEFTHSPQQPTRPVPLSGTCRGMDAGLVTVARKVARAFAQSGSPLMPEELTFELRHQGLPYVWPTLFTATGNGQNPSALRDRLMAWLDSQMTIGAPRCGVALERLPNNTDLLVAVGVDALADVRPVPRRVRLHEAVTLTSELRVPAGAVSVLALGPVGLPLDVPVNFEPTLGLARATTALQVPGRWVLQLLAELETGPRPVAEVEVWVDTPPPEAFESGVVPGESVDTTGQPHAFALTKLLNAARQSEQLAALEVDPSLSELALQHARAMSRQQLTGHDVGDGDPERRLQHYRLPNGLAKGPVGENVARATSLRGAHRVLWQSPAHRRTLLYKEFTHVGVGVVEGPGGEVWVCELFVGPGKVETRSPN